MFVRRIPSLLLAVALFVGSGCNLLRPRPTLEPTPAAFAVAAPTLEQIALAVNANSERIQSLQAREARMVIKGIPALSLDIAYERARRFRLRASTAFTGQELDLGSNDELFWFWTKQSPQPAIFYARHDQFAMSTNRSMMPIEPLWIVDALGIPRFDPNLRHEGPIAKGNHLLEIRTRIPTPEGEMTKLTVVNDQYAWVIQQQIFDPRGRLLISAQTSDHEYYPYAQASLPRKAALDIPAVSLAFQIETGGYLLNQPLGDSAAMFALPQDQLPGYQLIDIADPRFAPPGVPQNTPPVGFPTTSQAPRLRGY